MTHAVAIEVTLTDVEAKIAQEAYPHLDAGAAICAYLNLKLINAGVVCTLQGVFYEPPKS
jgi:hypothetical protein